MLPKRVPLQSFFSQGGNKMSENKTSEILSHESGKSGLEGIFFFLSFSHPLGLHLSFYPVH